MFKERAQSACFSNDEGSNGNGRTGTQGTQENGSHGSDKGGATQTLSSRAKSMLKFQQANKEDEEEEIGKAFNFHKVLKEKLQDKFDDYNMNTY